MWLQEIEVESVMPAKKYDPKYKLESISWLIFSRKGKPSSVYDWLECSGEEQEFFFRA